MKKIYFLDIIEFLQSGILFGAIDFTVFLKIFVSFERVPGS